MQTHWSLVFQTFTTVLHLTVDGLENREAPAIILGQSTETPLHILEQRKHLGTNVPVVEQLDDPLPDVVTGRTLWVENPLDILQVPAFHCKNDWPGEKQLFGLVGLQVEKITSMWSRQNTWLWLTMWGGNANGKIVHEWMLSRFSKIYPEIVTFLINYTTLKSQLNAHMKPSLNFDSSSEGFTK